DLAQHKRRATVNIHGMSIQAGLAKLPAKIDGGGVEDVDGEERQRAQAGQSVANKAQVAFAAAIKQTLHKGRYRGSQRGHTLPPDCRNIVVNVEIVSPMRVNIVQRA